VNEAMQGLIEEIELRLGHLRTLASLQGKVNDRNAELLRQVARLQGENQRLRAELNEREYKLAGQAKRIWAQA